MILTLFLTAMFFGIYTTIPHVHLLVILNGMFVGALIGLTVAYLPLLWDAFAGVGEYSRGRQMALGVGIGWLGTTSIIWHSIYVRSLDAVVLADPTFMSLFGRYALIVAATVQVTAPDLGKPAFYGRDRRFLWSGLVIGFLVTVSLIQLQGMRFLR